MQRHLLVDCLYCLLVFLFGREQLGAALMEGAVGLRHLSEQLAGIPEVALHDVPDGRIELLLIELLARAIAAVL
ncbi:MAG: hypothetical protein ACRELG_11385 [Gemmataceae bacterium]